MNIGWTQPVCLEHWIEREGDRVPTRLAESVREKEICVDCGEPTYSGIYIRVDPAEAKYPTLTR